MIVAECDNCGCRGVLVSVMTCGGEGSLCGKCRNLDQEAIDHEYTMIEDGVVAKHMGHAERLAAGDE